ncbi:major tail protein [Clostridium botulinum]|uniref:major tail protein n=1 Tax=Clostridium botulinum TaxID=1491 RepID=UPI00069AADF6|nr:major tail protein [Clostridium botulinum]KOA90873.1 major tail protein [Clostridium botulinum]MCD3203436.1 phage tail protein [Clostridium botulinum C/D]MCD3222299.1 phage tail protein [Clostridium botulinum C/D]MCD3231430.1 phage tail protein [Clostridium botulinum C/D]MCD3273072.1 phage tail protein [Clostridium botulinum C/D]
MSKMVVKSRRMGLRDISIAKVLENSVEKYTTTSVEKLARSISAKVTEKKNVEKVTSDDTTEDVIETLESIEVEIELNDLSPEQESMLKGSKYENGFLIDNKDDQSNEIAIGWRAKRTDKKYEFSWLYCGKFSEGSTDNYETAGDKLKTQTPKLKGTFYPRQKDGNWRVRVNESYLLESNTDAKGAIKDWFSKVQDPITSSK